MGGLALFKMDRRCNRFRDRLPSFQDRRAVSSARSVRRREQHSVLRHRICSRVSRGDISRTDETPRRGHSHAWSIGASHIWRFSRNGPIDGGTRVSITGTNLKSIGFVRFAGNDARIFGEARRIRTGASRSHVCPSRRGPAHRSDPRWFRRNHFRVRVMPHPRHRQARHRAACSPRRLLKRLVAPDHLPLLIASKRGNTRNGDRGNLHPRRDDHDDGACAPRPPLPNAFLPIARTRAHARLAIVVLALPSSECSAWRRIQPGETKNTMSSISPSASSVHSPLASPWTVLPSSRLYRYAPCGEGGTSKTNSNLSLSPPGESAQSWPTPSFRLAPSGPHLYATMGEPRGGRACGLGDCAARRAAAPVSCSQSAPASARQAVWRRHHQARSGMRRVRSTPSSRTRCVQLRRVRRRSFVRRSDRPLFTDTAAYGSTRSRRARLPRARARPGARVDEVSCENGHVTARLGRKVVRASVVVGADGANGIVAKSAGLGKDIMRGIALEGNVAWGDLDERRHRGQALFDVGVVPGGYGWVFPARTRKSRRRRLGYRRVKTSRPSRPSGGIVWSASHCAVGRQGPSPAHARPGGRVSAGRVLLVGDAAGLVDPLSGDGIYEAFVSGRLAADCFRRPDAIPDCARARARLAPARSWVAASTRSPSHVVLLGRACPMGLRGGCRLVRGDLRHPNKQSAPRGTAVALDRSSRPLDPAGPGIERRDLRRA